MIQDQYQYYNNIQLSPIETVDLVYNIITYLPFIMAAISIYLIIYKRKVENINENKFNNSADYKINILTQRYRKYQFQNQIVVPNLVVIIVLNYFIDGLYDILQQPGQLEQLLRNLFDIYYSYGLIPLLTLLVPVVQSMNRSRKQKKLKMQNKMYVEAMNLTIYFMIFTIILYFVMITMMVMGLPYLTYPIPIYEFLALFVIFLCFSFLMVINELKIKRIQKRILQNYSKYGLVALKTALTNQERIEKLSKIFSISDEVKIEPTAELIDMDKLEFLDFLKNAKDLPELKIDGDYIVLISTKTLDEFVDVLDKQFNSWEATAKTKDGKINKI